MDLHSIFPFAVAFAILLLLAVAQVLGLGDLIGDADGDADGALDGLLSVFGIGQVPLLIWAAILLFTFSGTGVTGQFALETLTGAMLPPGLAALAALLPSLLFTALLARLLSPILPRDETTAVPIESLLGKRGAIDIGTARRGHPARVIVRDEFGKPHNVMVEPHDDSADFTTGEEVLLVRLENGLFYAISTSDRRLGPVT